MSGPKCMEMTPTTLATARRVNSAECKHTLAGYRCLFVRFERLGEQLGDLGLESPDKPIRSEQLAKEVEKAFATPSCDGSEMMLHLYRQKGRLEKLIQESEGRIQARVVDLQQRFQSLAQNSDQLRLLAVQLESYAQAMLPAEWPAQKREAILKNLRAAQKDAQPPPAIKAELSIAGIARLEKAEQSVVNANRKLEQWQRSIDAELQAAHEAKVKDAQAAKVAAEKVAAATVRNRETEHQKKLQRELFRTAPPLSISEFLANLAKKNALPPEEGKALKKLGDLLAKIGALQDTAGWSDLMRRAAAIRAETTPYRQLQFLEGLCLEAGTRLKALRAVATWQAAVDVLLQEAADYAGPAMDIVVAELRELRRAGRVVPLEPWKQRLAETEARELARQQREHKRRAILESLTALGYEISEGMEAALVKAGKLVIHKPGEADYAIELVSNADLSLMQTDMVRYADSDTLTEQQRLRDHEREAEWCGDHKRIRDQLEQRGYETRFKMQLPAGAHPVRVVQRTTSRRASSRTRGKVRSV